MWLDEFAVLGYPPWNVLVLVVVRDLAQSLAFALVLCIDVECCVASGFGGACNGRSGTRFRGDACRRLSSFHSIFVLKASGASGPPCLRRER